MTRKQDQDPAQTTSEVINPEQEPEQEPELEAEEVQTLPLKFVMKKGCPRMKTLRPSRTGVDSISGIKFTIPGVVWVARKYQPDPAIRIIDVQEQDAVRRAEFPIEPEDMARMIMASKEFQRGLLIPWEDYLDEKAEAKAELDAILKVRAEHQAMRAAKAGKRGWAGAAQAVER